MFPSTATATATSHSNSVCPFVFSGFGQTPSTFTAFSHGFGGMSNSHGTSSWTSNPPLSNQTTFAAPSFNFGTSTSTSGGSRVENYKTTADEASKKEKLVSISAMPVYQNKSHEELRWEDNNFTRKVPSTTSSGNIISSESASKGLAWKYSGPATTWSTSQPLESSSSANTFLTTPSNSFNPFAPKTTFNPFAPKPTFTTSTAVSAPHADSLNPYAPRTTFTTSTAVPAPRADSFNPFAPRATSTSTAVSAPRAESFNPFAPRTTFSTSTDVSAPRAVSFNPFAPRTTFTTSTVSATRADLFNSFAPFNSTTVSAPNVNSYNPFPSTLFPTNAVWSTPVTEPSVIATAKPISVSPGLNSTYNQPTTLVNPSVTSTQNCNTGTICQSSTSQLYSSQTNRTEQPASPASPFGTLPPKPQMISQPTQPIQYGISSIPVKDKPAPVRCPQLTTRHLSSRCKLPLRKYDPKQNGPKIPFYNDTKEIPINVFVPRENPRALVISPEMWQRLAINEKFSGKVENDRDEDPTTDVKLQSTVLDVPIKHPQADYYTEPQISELEAKERADPGFCRHVKDFVVGRHGYGSIKFLGETDVRKLDLESHVQFNNREVIVYTDETKKPPVGEGLNKPAEITLLNVKCFDKKTGMQYMDGPKIDKYTQRLKEKAVTQGVEFMSYDPTEGEWKFRVQHF